MSTRTWLVIGYFLIMLGGFGYLLVWLIRDMRSHYLVSMEESLVDLSVLMAADLSQQTRGDTIVISSFEKGIAAALNRSFKVSIKRVIKDYISLRIYVTDKTGIVLYDSDNNWARGKDYKQWNDVYLTLQGKYGTRFSSQDSYDIGSPYIYVGAPIYHNSTIVGVLSVGKPVNTVSALVNIARMRLVWLFLFIGGGVLVLGIFFTRMITNPIVKITSYAAAIRDGLDPQPPFFSFSRWLPNKEIRTLSKTILEMRDALTGKRKHNEYIQTLNHELKNPISSILSAVTLIKETPSFSPEEKASLIDDIEVDGKRLLALTNRIKELALLEYHSMKRELTTLDLVTLCKDVTASMNAISNHKNIRMERSFPDQPALFRGEQVPLSIAISNVVKNALDFTPESGTIFLSLTQEKRKEKQYWYLIIEDTGSGILEYLLPKVFDRFFSTQRQDSQLRSTGIGLTYARETIIQHQGTIQLSNRPEGGTKVEITLPLNV